MNSTLFHHNHNHLLFPQLETRRFMLNVVLCFYCHDIVKYIALYMHKLVQYNICTLVLLASFLYSNKQLHES